MWSFGTRRKLDFTIAKLLRDHLNDVITNDLSAMVSRQINNIFDFLLFIRIINKLFFYGNVYIPFCRLTFFFFRKDVFTEPCINN
jgi:hypothetical protein